MIRFLNVFSGTRRKILFYGMFCLLVFAASVLIHRPPNVSDEKKGLEESAQTDPAPDDSDDMDEFDDEEDGEPVPAASQKRPTEKKRPVAAIETKANTRKDADMDTASSVTPDRKKSPLIEKEKFDPTLVDRAEALRNRISTFAEQVADHVSRRNTRDKKVESDFAGEDAEDNSEDDDWEDDDE